MGMTLDANTKNRTYERIDNLDFSKIKKLMLCKICCQGNKNTDHKLEKIFAKRNTFESVLIRWMKLEPIIQGEVSQKVNNEHCILTHIYMES